MVTLLRIVVLFFAALSGACYSVTPLVQGSLNGYLLPGPRAAQVFGVDARTRLHELFPGSVPERVQAAADSRAHEQGRVAACNRYFGADSVIVVVYSPFCGTLFGKEVDARRLGAFTPQGDLIGEISWMVQPGVAELEPFMR
jgi:hypothetical protein